MAQWIDPRERRAMWYFSTLFVLCVLSIIAMVSLLLWGEQTSEERMITVVAGVLALVGSVLAIRQIRKTPRDFQQLGNQDDIHGGS